jgi:hypothetical protein
VASSSIQTGPAEAEGFHPQPTTPSPQIISVPGNRNDLMIGIL